MRTMTHGRLADHAARRHGLFTASEALAMGVTPRAIRWGAQTGRYEMVEAGVYVVRGCPPSWEQAAMIAVLTQGPLAAASHQTAAFLWGLTSLRPTAIEVVTRRWRRIKRDCLIHESTDLIPDDIIRLGGVLVTSATRTVVDLGASAAFLVEGALDNGLRRDLFSVGDVAAFVDRVGRRGRRGVGVIRPLIDARLSWAEKTESDLEDLFRRVLARFDVAQPTPQFSICEPNGAFVSRADFAYPDARVAIELDSEAYHLDRTTFHYDRWKQNRAAILGWQTLRYTWKDLTTRAEAVAAEITAVLIRRAPKAG